MNTNGPLMSRSIHDLYPDNYPEREAHPNPPAMQTDSPVSFLR